MKRLIVLGALVAAVVGAVIVWETEPPWFERIRYPLKYQSIVRAHAHNYHLDPALLAAVIYEESKFNPTARSSQGAIGLMQLTPDTAKGIALRTGGGKFRVSDLTDPEINIRYGSWYLQNLLTKYGNERDALAAYNAGQGNVDKWLAAGEDIQFPETRTYVSAVEHLKEVYREAWGNELGLT